MAVDVLLVTCTALRDGEPGHEVLDEALADRGIRAQWVCWDDPDVDWTAGLVAVRSTWDYDARVEEFLAWARAVPRLMNGAAVFAWNIDKAYLLELAAAGLAVIPTLVVDTAVALPAAIASFDKAVVKPRVGAGGRGVGIGAAAGPGPWVVQPLVASVRTEGESSVFVLGGEPLSMVRKLPTGREIRVQEEYGGTSVAIVPTAEATNVARRTVQAAERILGTRLDYARVDLMRGADGVLAISELEVTEPGLYLRELPANGPAFADLVARVLARG
jgi:glutathione synthase/RimK-type ligase-like ATP-grasp enzyme